MRCSDRRCRRLRAFFKSGSRSTVMYVVPWRINPTHNSFLIPLLPLPAHYLRSRSTKLGVLGWCNDFKELVDAVKDAGVGGTLFVATRDQGLQTCRQVLSMELDIKKGMVLLYLSTQISRLRRFLDGEVDPEQHTDPGVSFSS